jgi:hypothetical protein
MTILQTNDIDIRILGDEYERKLFTGSNLDMDYYFNKRTHNYSTTELRKRVALKESQLGGSETDNTKQ